MSKDAYWFRHDCNARNDAKVVKLRRLGGLEAVGLYWCVIETLREANAYQLPEFAIEDICFDLRVDKKVFAMLFSCNLLKLSDGMFFSPSLNDRMLTLEAKREKLKKNGRKGGLAKAKQMLSKRQANEKQLLSDKSRVEKNRKEKSRVENSFCAESVFTAQRSGLEKQVCAALERKYKDRLLELKVDTIEKLITNLSSKIFGGVDVPAQIEAAAIWEDSNPTQRKTARGVPRYLTGWMSRAQNRGGQKGRVGSPMGNCDDGEAIESWGRIVQRMKGDKLELTAIEKQALKSIGKTTYDLRAANSYALATDRTNYIKVFKHLKNKEA